MKILISTVPTGLFINNAFVPSLSGSILETLNPATGKLLGTVFAAESADIDAAVNAAETAFKNTWRDTQGNARGALLHRLADLISRDGDELAAIEALDAGVLFNESKHLNIVNAVEVLRYFAGWADKIDGKSIRIPNGMATTRREPVGVCAAIVPWNAPL
jgi:aldehyde dehydrogenase (NAD+)